MNGDNIEAHRQINQERMLRALHRFVWETSHADDKCPRKYAHVTVRRMQDDLCEMLGIRRIARR